jgi:hypothetical protein
MPDSQDRVAERVRHALPAGAWEAIEHDLSPTDLQSLLIAVARARARQITAADVMRRWQHDRFVRPGHLIRAAWPRSRAGCGSCYRSGSAGLSCRRSRPWAVAAR